LFLGRFISNFEKKISVESLSRNILLLTPPFTNLNTPYPATAYIKGFLATQNVSSVQFDLGLEVILRIFSKEGLKLAFEKIAEKNQKSFSVNVQRIISLKKEYLNAITPVILFLQHKNPTLAYTISEGDFLPQASRFDQIGDLEWAFGSMGIHDKARHLATLFLEDLGDLITEALDPDFGFSRYAERLGRSAVSFDPLEERLNEQPSFTDQFLLEELEKALLQSQPKMVCLSVPFPGNLYGALKCGQYIKQNYPHVKVVMGGGYPNTELRSLGEVRVFKYLDFITLDDGERPLVCLLEHLDGKRSISELKRTYTLENEEVKYFNGCKLSDISFNQTGTPDYSGLRIHDYLSIIELMNPMHRLWSDGRWNKLTMAHGCYWKKCSFCDITLDYIKNYEPINAGIICDRIEELIQQTGQTGFHFVDEAAPPALMKEVAIEILKRNLKISWWTNIRFEESFTEDLCRLLRASGCIAVSGGLEVASDRLLEMMQKGVTVSQVAKVAYNFTNAGVMVHAYLMYGFPTQTELETINSLEMVRQLFEHNVIQSGFWHLFAMTSHAPIGQSPEKFNVKRIGPQKGLFADNDLTHDDPTGADHEKFSHGLKKAIFNYMHGQCFEFPLQEWFDFKIPKTTIPNNYIYKSIVQAEVKAPKPTNKVIWLGNQPLVKEQQKAKQGNQPPRAKIVFQNKLETFEIQTSIQEAEWIAMIFPLLIPESSKKTWTLAEITQDFESRGMNFNKFQTSGIWQALKAEGLVYV
jgi:hypothetical protein